MATTLPDSGLKIQDAYGESQWFADYQDNWVRLNNTLLKYSALLDVDVTGLSTGDVLKWSTSSSMWEPYTPNHNPLGVGQSTTTTTTSTTTTTTVFLLDFLGEEDYSIPAKLKRNFQVSDESFDADIFGVYAGSLAWNQLTSVELEFSLMSRFLLTGDPIECVVTMDFPDACHPSGSNNYPLLLSFWNEARTKACGCYLLINYYNGYRRNFGCHYDGTVLPPLTELGVTNSANAPMDTPFCLRVYKGGSHFWVWYWKDNYWQFNQVATGYNLDDEWFTGPVWVELHGYRQASGGVSDYRIRTFSVLQGTVTYPSTTTTTTTTTNTLTTTTQTVPLNDEGFDVPFANPANWSFSDSDKLGLRSAGSAWRTARSKAYVTEGMPEGTKFYWEIYCITPEATNRTMVGCATENTLNSIYPGNVTDGGFGVYSYSGTTYYNGSTISNGFGAWECPAIVQVAIDIRGASNQKGRAWVGLNGVWSDYYHDTGSTDVPYLRPSIYDLGGTKFYAACCNYYSGREYRIYTRPEDWTYTCPTGFVAMPSNDT